MRLTGFIVLMTLPLCVSCQKSGTASRDADVGEAAMSCDNRIRHEIREAERSLDLASRAARDRNISQPSKQASNELQKLYKAHSIVRDLIPEQFMRPNYSCWGSPPNECTPQESNGAL